MKRANMTTLDKLAGYEAIEWPVNIHFPEGDEAEFGLGHEDREAQGAQVGYRRHA